MKKVYYLIAFVVVTSIAISSCTEENVVVKERTYPAGGGGMTGPLR